MGSPNLHYSTYGTLECDTAVILGYIALDGSSNVVGSAPTGPGALVATTPYTRAKGLQKALGQAGAVINQPHTTTGTYIFTLDESWIALSGVVVQPIDSGAVSTLDYFVDANVTSGTSSQIGYLPGNNPALAAQTVRVLCRNSSGSLANPPANTGFWLKLELMKRLVP